MQRTHIAKITSNNISIVTVAIEAIIAMRLMVELPSFSRSFRGVCVSEELRTSSKWLELYIFPTGGAR